MIDSYIDEVINARKEVGVITINGFHVKGRIIHDFADHIVILSEGKKKMLYKHAISTIYPL